MEINYCVAYIGYANECGEPSSEVIEGFPYCEDHAARMHGLEAMAERNADA